MNIVTNSSEQFETFMEEAEKSLGDMPEKDTINYWLDLPRSHLDYDNKPKPSPECNSNCSKILNGEGIFSKRLMRIETFSAEGYNGIDHSSWLELCELCKMKVYEWFYDDAWADHPEYRLSLREFEQMTFDHDERRSQIVSSDDHDEEYIPEWEWE